MYTEYISRYLLLIYLIPCSTIRTINTEFWFRCEIIICCQMYDYIYFVSLIVTEPFNEAAIHDLQLPGAEKHLNSRKIRVPKEFDKPMLDITRRMLYRFYKPYNQRLVDMLGPHFDFWSSDRAITDRNKNELNVLIIICFINLSGSCSYVTK